MNTLLLLLLDSRSPAGAHHHSAGMEPAITAGIVATFEDVRSFCRTRLATTAPTAAAFAAAGCLAWETRAGPAHLDALDAELDARTPSEGQRAASRALGRGLLRLARTLCPAVASAAAFTGPDSGPHHPLVLGAAVCACGGTAEMAARAAALASCSAPASAAVRLLGLDPLAVQTMLAGLAEEIDTIAHRCAALAETTPPELLPSAAAPALDLLADAHLTEEVRLFAS